MATTSDPVAAPVTGSSTYSGARGASPGWLGRRRGLFIGGAVTVAVAALALSQHWLAVADLVPLLFVLPCAVMMFVCMKGMNHGQQAGVTPTPTRTETPITFDTTN